MIERTMHWHLKLRTEEKLLSFQNSSVIKKSDIARGYQTRPSIAHFLPWCDYHDKHKVFLLEDRATLATVFSIRPIACEARPEAMMQQIAFSLKEAIQNAVPSEKNNPWILQLFSVRQNDLSKPLDLMAKTIDPARFNDPLVKAHMITMQAHLDYVSHPEGIFIDHQVTQQVFRGGYLNTYAVLYQRRGDMQDKNPRYSALEQIKRVSRKLADQWRQCGLGVKRLSGDEFYHWMARWFNPKPKQTNGDIEKLLKILKFPKEHEKPFGWDLSEQLFFSAPESFEEGWLFDGLPHKVLTIQSLSADPAVGHLSAERKRGADDKVFHLLDQLPEGSIFSMTIVMQAQSEVELHLKQIHDGAVGRHALAMKVKSEVETAQQAIADGDYLLPTIMVVYVRGNDLEQLHEREAQVEVLLNGNGFKVITDDELYPIDAYLRYLPMSYNFGFDRKYNYRSRYLLLTDIAKLLPVYGRCRGTGNPGMLMFNRGGEPFLYDIFKDRTKNAHLLLLGETGTGKSNLLNFLAMQLLTLYNPRLFFIEAGGSFDLLANYCASLGLTVNRVKIDPKNPLSLNPFAQGLKVLGQVAELAAQGEAQRVKLMEDAEGRLEKELYKKTTDAILADPTDDEEGDSRDVLGDMVLAALVMITGGEGKEEERITRSDRMLIMDAILEAARRVKNAGVPQMIAADVVDAFEVLAQRLDPQRDADKIRRASEMADGMRYFIQDPVSSRFFNSYGEPWPLADITVVDFGLFAQEGYEAQRSIAFAGVVGKILALAESNQFSQRSMVAIFDENHLFSKLPLLAAIQTRIAKMGRKLGLWLWLATQNLKDFPDEARKMLSLIENWLCLALPPDEIDQIERFKPLTEEQRALFLSARKEKGKYTEGVLLTARLQALFRNVPPKLYLAMAATEQHEKHERKQLMQTLECSELDVVHHIANQMMQKPIEDLIDD
jgi:conjugative transfer ATPase